MKTRGLVTWLFTKEGYLIQHCCKALMTHAIDSRRKEGEGDGIADHRGEAVREDGKGHTHTRGCGHDYRTD